MIFTFLSFLVIQKLTNYNVSSQDTNNNFYFFSCLQGIAHYTSCGSKFALFASLEGNRLTRGYTYFTSESPILRFHACPNTTTPTPTQTALHDRTRLRLGGKPSLFGLCFSAFRKEGEALALFSQNSLNIFS